jgi:hypothetical protein
MHRDPQVFRPPRLARSEWALVALGLAVWLALALGGVWFVHQLIRPRASCGGQIEARSALPGGRSGTPRNALQLLAGTGRCQ